MKNIITIILLVSYSGIHAQNLKGKIMMGGYISYSSSHTNTTDTASNTTHSVTIDKNKSMNLNFGITPGYFITNRIAVGIIGAYNRITYTYATNDPLIINYDNESGQIFQTYSVGGFARYYQPIKASRFSAFCQLSVQQGWNKTSNWYATYDGGTRNVHEQLSGKLQVNLVSLNPGVVYFITDKIGLETSFGSLSASTSRRANYKGGHQTGTESGTTAGLSFDLSTLRFGVNIYFGVKTKAPKIS